MKNYWLLMTFFGIVGCQSTDKEMMPQSTPTSDAFESAAKPKTEPALEQTNTEEQKNLIEGRAFLSTNAQRDSVFVLPTGVQFEILKQGKGELPRLTDTYVVHYEGRRINGEVFDSSYGKDPFYCETDDDIIKGWQDVLPRMPLGSKFRIYIPATSGYGSRGYGPIGPYEVMIFDVELLKLIHN